MSKQVLNKSNEVVTEKNSVNRQKSNNCDYSKFKLDLNLNNPIKNSVIKLSDKTELNIDYNVKSIIEKLSDNKSYTFPILDFKFLLAKFNGLNIQFNQLNKTNETAIKNVGFKWSKKTDKNQISWLTYYNTILKFKSPIKLNNGYILTKLHGGFNLLFVSPNDQKKSDNQLIEFYRIDTPTK